MKKIIEIFSPALFTGIYSADLRSAPIKYTYSFCPHKSSKTNTALSQQHPQQAELPARIKSIFISA